MDSIVNYGPEGYYDFIWRCFVSVSTVSLNKSFLSMTAGDAAALTAVFSPSNTTDKSLAWASSDSSVVSVNFSGRLTAKKAGKAAFQMRFFAYRRQKIRFMPFLMRAASMM